MKNIERAFEILGIEPVKDPNYIRMAYLNKVKKIHPDINKSFGATEDFKRVNEAYHRIKESISKEKVSPISHLPFRYIKKSPESIVYKAVDVYI